MDGYEQKKKRIDKRKGKYLKTLQDIQSNTMWDPENCGHGVALHAKSTFLAVLREMKIQVYVSDYESDKDIAALANQYKCPVFKFRL